MRAGWWGAFLAVLVGLLQDAAGEPRPKTRCLGAPNAGRLEHARRLRARPYLRIKTRSVRSAWGHPLLLQLLEGGARAAAAPGGMVGGGGAVAPGRRAVALVGDLSARGGGPIARHASHQVGRDADVAFFATDPFGRPAVLAEFVRFEGSGRSADGQLVFDSRRNWLMLRHWLTDMRVPIAAIFVAAPIRRLLLDYGAATPDFAGLVPLARAVLKPHRAHADHFHLRIACPSDQGPACIERSRRGMQAKASGRRSSRSAHSLRRTNAPSSMDGSVFLSKEEGQPTRRPTPLPPPNGR